MPRNKTALAVGALIVLLLVTAAGTFLATQRLAQATRGLNESQQRLAAITDVAAALVDVQAGHEALALTGDPRYLDDPGSAALAFDQQLERLRELSAADPIQEKRLNQLPELIAAERITLSRLASLRRGGISDVARYSEATDRWLKAHGDTQDLLGEMLQDERVWLEEQLQANRYAHALALAGGLGLLLLGLIGAGGLVRLLRREGQVRAEAAAGVHAQREILEAVVGRVGESVIAIDAEGLITLLNGPASTLTGCPIAEALHKHLSAVFRVVEAQSRRPIDSSALDALRWGRVVVHPTAVLLLARDGREVLIEQSAAPIRTEAGKATGAVLVFWRRDDSLASDPFR
jgi:PAS domain S-box-containing protein